MFSPQNRLKVIIKPFPVPKSPHSATSSPKASKSIEFSTSERFPSTSPRPTNSILIKTLDDLSNLFQSAKRKPKKSEKDIQDLMETCEKSVKITKLKILETPFEDEGAKTEGKSISDLSSIIKTGSDEYSSFLEHLLNYEQKKSDLIIEKSKFPKIRMKEVETALNEEFLFRQSNSAKSLKLKESSFQDKAKKEIKELYLKSMKRLKEGAGIPSEIANILEKDESSEKIEVEKAIKKNREFIHDGNLFIKNFEKLHNELSQLKTDSEKLSVKYNYLIGKFNNQDKTLKRQSKILANISKNTAELKSIFLILVAEVKDFFSTLIEALSKKSLSRISGKELYEQQKAILLKEKEALQLENENLKEKNKALEKKLKKSLEDALRLKSELDSKDDNLSLRSNINDIIEIQKLKDQVRLITFKSNDAIDQYKRENASLLGQVCRLKEDNYSLESKLKLLSRLNETRGDKTQDFNEKNSSESSKNPQNSVDLISLGADSSEKSVKINDIFDMLREDIDDIVQGVKNHSVFFQFQGNSVEFLRKLCGLVVKLKENVCEKNCSFEETVEKLIATHRSRTLAKSENSSQELVIKDKQLGIYQSKLDAKKSQVGLLKLQNNYLKQTIQELKSELENTNQLDLDCIKGLLHSVFKEIPKLSSNAENLIFVLMRNIGFSSAEINQLKLSKKARRGSFFL